MLCYASALLSYVFQRISGCLREATHTHMSPALSAGVTNAAVSFTHHPAGNSSLLFVAEVSSTLFRQNSNVPCLQMNTKKYGNVRIEAIPEIFYLATTEPPLSALCPF
ncbi:hypothetical protein F4859DRAFT_430966 [Xylaria cf. heliscus]|nr:hypothetical protein F4859DRAFT_430966 [Xylaria cf. heliscus]